MKKIIIYTFLILFMTTFSFAQEKTKGKTFKIKETFNSLEVVGQIETLLIPTEESPKMVIYTEDLNILESEHIDTKLKIKIESTFFSPEKEIAKPKIEIYYNKPIQMIKLLEASISNKDTLNQISIDLFLDKKARADLLINMQKITIKGAKGSTAFVKGKTIVNEANLSSGSVLEAEKLISDQVDVKVKGSGTIAYVYANILIEAFSTTQGLVRINGNPLKVVREQSFGGTIVKMENSAKDN